MNKKTILLFLLGIMVVAIQVYSQPKQADARKAKVEVFYFHPTERCPIDQSIEESVRKLIQGDFAAQVREGKVKLLVINTDDKSQAKTVNRFEINAQALYVVYSEKGKEVKKDLTEFAFSTAQSKPERFKTSLKEEILEALK